MYRRRHGRRLRRRAVREAHIDTRPAQLAPGGVAQVQGPRAAPALEGDEQAGPACRETQVGALAPQEIEERDCFFFHTLYCFLAAGLAFALYVPPSFFLILESHILCALQKSEGTKSILPQSGLPFFLLLLRLPASSPAVLSAPRKNQERQSGIKSHYGTFPRALCSAPLLVAVPSIHLTCSVSRVRGYRCDAITFRTRARCRTESRS